jgi:cold shock CspA family protein
MKMRGCVKFYLPQKGYGFVVPESDTGAPEIRDVWFMPRTI